MQQIARLVGAVWIGGVVCLGMWLGLSGLFWGAPGLVFDSGFADVWVLAILASPGYFLWKWGGQTNSK